MTTTDRTNDVIRVYAENGTLHYEGTSRYSADAAINRLGEDLGRVDTTPTPLPTEATLDQELEYVDRTLQTASWWDRYSLHPGTYPVRYTNVNGEDVDEFGGRAYYAVVQVPALLVQSYRVNRLFTASSAQMDYPDTEEFVTFRWYAYEVYSGMTSRGLRFN